jgi:hypothetical protein
VNDNIYEQCQVGLNKFVVESAPVVSLFDSSLFIVTKKKKKQATKTIQRINIIITITKCRL